MKNNNFGLLEGLFTSPNTETHKIDTNTFNENTRKVTKRTWKIYDDLWEDFVSIANINKLTQAELVNQLIDEAIKSNRDKIDKYRDITEKQ